MSLIINSTLNPNPNPNSTFTRTPTSPASTKSPSSSAPTPTKPQNWPLTLRTIKHLYTSHHYRQCIARAEDLLPLTEEPIHKTYLTFYTAISYEGMGLAAHNYSKNKLPLLQAAVEWFVVCGGWVADAYDASDTFLPTEVAEKEEEDEDGFEEECDRRRYSGMEGDTDSENGNEDENENDTLERSIAQMIGGIDLHGRGPFQDDPFIDREDSDLGHDEDGGEWTHIQGSDSDSNSRSDIFEGSPGPSLSDRDSDTDTDTDETPNNSYITTTNPNEPYGAIEEDLIPSPLKVRKASGESFEADILQKSGVNLDLDLEHVQQPFPQYKKLATVGGPSCDSVPALPVRVIPTAFHTHTHSHPHPHLQPISGSQSSYSHSSENIPPKHIHPHTTTSITHNEAKTKTLHSLSTQITTSITTLQTHINYITALQHARHMSRGMRRSGSFWSFSPIKSPATKDKDTGTSMSDAGSSGQTSTSTSLLKETKGQRIERLRKEGWRTVGIRSPRLGWKGEEYYRGLCEGVLGELYLGLTS
ncbi:hypothetical protein BO78DRAFT_468459 [Aspergillus sclerotiicarbonarius CBS 121057]|uniref:Uncharacterized protein n=1 Tax=Aspergillus sclerotiicarbonarius (strain CBS 121057 / IBT 28362) TaxID=1448318 RepID=A0A319EVM9_ASPSB|nr:hypothetical protein BO78DRAFT_468459 [Aspergillus sclerotiicarbonarius CBS 121057]